MVNNILFFPIERIKRNSPPQNIEEVHALVNDVQQYHVQEIIETVVPKLFEMLDVAGFQPQDDQQFESTLKSSAFIAESIRSFLGLIYNVEHPLQSVSENIFYIDCDGDVKIRDNIKITITNDDSGAQDTCEEDEE